MSSDDLTRDIANEVAKTTQPMITEIFNLLSELKSEVSARLDKIETRLDKIETRLDKIETRLDKIETRVDEVELRLARDIEAVNTRVTNGFSELSNKIDALNRSRLQTEADYQGLLQRVTNLESKTS